MSRKNRRQQEVEPAPSAASPAWPELFRRVLLAGITALIVARPLVLGEDPGMLEPLTDTAPLILPLFWLLALLAWAIWRFTSKQEEWHGGLVELGLLLAVLTVAVSTYAAPYRRPALLVTWEWVTLFAALVLLRQTATRQSDRRHLAAAMLATVVMLAAYAVYQYAFELPRVRAQLAESAPKPYPPQAWIAGFVGAGEAGPLQAVAFLDARIVERRSAATIGEGAAGHDPRHELAARASATYAHPASFAALLVLFLPALIAAATLRRKQAGLWQAGFALACVLLTAVALWLTQTRAAFGALAIAGIVALLLGAARGLLPLKPVLIATSAAAGIALLLVFTGGSDEAPTGIRGTAWSMIRDQPWFGIGAGNFSRACPRYLDTGAEPAANPQSFFLELWATSGIFALAAVLTACGAFFWLVHRTRSGLTLHPSLSTSEGLRWRSGSDVSDLAETDAPPAAGHEPTRWEFYSGGMVGLLLAFAIRQGGQSPDEVLGGLTRTPADELMEALVAAGRSLVWFAAFALFEGVRWPGRLLSSALAVGVGAALLLLAVSDGIGYPSVAGPLWLAMALALCALDNPPWRLSSRTGLACAAPLPLALGFFLAYYLYVFDPITRGASLARSGAGAAYRFSEEARTGFKTIKEPRKHLADRVVRPLEQAVKEDPGNARWQSHLATWYGQTWRWSLSGRDAKALRDYAFKSVMAANEAQRLDPDGREGYMIQHTLHLLFAETKRGAERDIQLSLAVEGLRRLTEHDRTNPQIHFRLARLLFEVGKPDEAIESAQNALTYDAPGLHPPRSLTPWQRFALAQWTGR